MSPHYVAECIMLLNTFLSSIDWPMLWLNYNWLKGSLDTICNLPHTKTVLIHLNPAITDLPVMEICLNQKPVLSPVKFLDVFIHFYMRVCLSDLPDLIAACLLQIVCRYIAVCFQVICSEVSKSRLFQYFFAVSTQFQGFKKMQPMDRPTDWWTDGLHYNECLEWKYKI